MEWLNASPGIEWMLQPLVVGAVLVLTILEYMAQHDEDIAMMLHDLNIHPILAACGICLRSPLFFSGPPNRRSGRLQSEAAKSGVVQQTQDIIIPYAKRQSLEIYILA